MPLRTTTGLPAMTWHGSFFVHHSIALVNRELTLALLDRGGVDVGIREYEPASFSPDVDPRFARLAACGRTAQSSPLVTVRHVWPPDFSRPVTPRYVLIQPWEFGSLPRSWVEGIAESVDECWVPSRYVKEVYEASGVPADKVFVVPNGVNVARFHAAAAPAAIPTRKAVKFLFVGGTIGRKGIDVLLDAYTTTFTDRDDVALVIKDFGRSSFYAGQDAAALIAALQAKPGAPEIVYLTEDMSEAEIAGLYTACDALVHPYRGEGYGLPIAEAMACGRPTIITGAGAAMDFADEETSYLLPAARVELPQRQIGDLLTVGQPWWYEPDRDALSCAMRCVFEDPAGARERGAVAARRIAERHTWEHAAEIAGARLDALFRSAAEARAGGRRNAARPAAIEPVAFENRKQRALALTREGKWHEALGEAAACLETQPADDDLQNALAVARYRTGDRPGAIAQLRELLLRSPRCRDFHHNLAFMLLSEGAGIEALRHAVQAATISPASPEIRRTLERARAAAQKEARRVRKSGGKDTAAFRVAADAIAEADALLSARNPSQVSQAAPFRPARLSVVMIARNEEQFLEQCLQSVVAAVDEIVVVDTGSTDRTAAIALRFGAKVVTHTWNDDFAAARNVSLEHATGDWALWLDADERLAEGDGDLLRYLVNAAEPTIGGYMVNIRNHMSRAEHQEICWHRACRLFRLDPRIRFAGRIHEQNVRGIQDAGYACALSQLTLDHYGYAAEVMNARGKHERFIRMLTREVEENPDEAYRTFHLFNLGNAYFTRGDMKNAAHWLKQAAEGADAFEEYTSLLFVELATALYSTGQPQEALDACDLADATGVDHPGIDFARGHAHLHLGEYAAAERHFRSAVERGRTGTFVHSGDAGAYTYKAHYGVALALTGQERHEEAVAECRLAISESERFADARYLLASGLRRIGDRDGARAEFEALLRIAPSHTLTVVDHACLLHEMGDLPSALAALRRASTVQPANLEVSSRLGACCEALGLCDESRDAYMAARRLAPASGEIAVNLGRAHAALGAHDQALDCFTDAIRLAPRYANAYFNAGDLLYELGYHAKAAEALCAGLEIEPSHAPAFLVLGNCFVKLGQLPAAREAFTLAVTQRPDYAEAASNLDLVEGLLSEQAA